MTDASLDQKHRFIGVLPAVGPGDSLSGRPGRTDPSAWPTRRSLLGRSRCRRVLRGGQMSVLSVQPLSEINQQRGLRQYIPRCNVPRGRMQSDQPGTPGPVRDNPSHRIGHLTWLYDFNNCKSKCEQFEWIPGFGQVLDAGTHRNSLISHAPRGIACNNIFGLFILVYEKISPW